MEEQDTITKELSSIREEQKEQRELLEELHKHVKGVRTTGRVRLALYGLLLLFLFGSVFTYYRTIVTMFEM